LASRQRRSRRVVEGAEHLTPNYIADLLETLRTRYADRNEQILDLRKLRFMQDTNENEVPEALRESNPAIRTYVAGKWVENEVGALTTLPPRVHVPVPPNASPEDRERAESIERFLPALWERMERERGRDTYRQLFDHAIADGVGVLKGHFRPSAWHKLPSVRAYAREARAEMSDEDILAVLDEPSLARYTQAQERFVQRNPLPLACRTVDPTTVFPVYGEFGLDCVLEESRRPLLAVKRMAGAFGGLPLSADDPELGSLVRIVEYWDSEYFALYAELSPRADGMGNRHESGGLRLVGTMEHRLGRIPYWFVLGQETSSTDPRFEAISTLFKIKDAVPAFHRMLNQYLTVVRQKAYTSFQQKRAPSGPTDANAEPVHQKLIPGTVTYVDDTIEDPFIRPIEWPAMEANLPVVMNMLLAISQQTQIDRAATGGEGSSGESGFLRAQLVDLARTGYHQIIAHAERALSSYFEWCLEMIDTRLKRPIYARARGSKDSKVEWLSVGPDLIREDYAVDVKIIPFNPIMDIARGTFGANMIRGKIYPREWTYENVMGVENPGELMDDLLADEMMEHPGVRQALVLRAARRAGLMELAGSQQPVAPGEAQLLAALGGAMGGRPTASPSVPGVGAPIAGAANQPMSVPIGMAGGEEG